MKNNFKIPRGTEVGLHCRAQKFDAKTGVLISEKQAHNLVFDSGLNDLANAAQGFGNFFKCCKIGSGTTPNSIASGVTLFTQSGTTITAAGAGVVFFTPAMVGSVFKWGSGSGGNETYITAVTGTPVSGVYPSATVLTSATVGTPAAATVWLVTQTGLQSFLYASTTYGTVGSPVSFTGNVLTLIRQMVFPVQSSPYTVNEIGYGSDTGGTGVCNGRIVLGSPDIVPITEFYVVTWTLTATLTPGAPTAVADVSGGTFNTAGTAMLLFWDCQDVATNGSTGNYQVNGCSLFDRTQGVNALLTSSAPSLPGAIQTGAITVLTGLYAFGNFSISNPSPSQTIVNNLAVVIGTATQTFSFSTAGETCYGFAFGQNNSGNSLYAAMQLNFTTPVTLPSGTFAGNFTFTNTFGRQLSN